MEALLVLPGMATARTTTSPYIVVYNSGVGNVRTDTSTLEAQHGFTPTFVYANALKGFAASLTTSTQLSGIQSNPAIEYVEPDTTVSATGMVSLAAGEAEPVGIRRIGAPQRLRCTPPAA